MAKHKQEYANRNITLTSGSAAATYSPPIPYVTVRGAGNVVLKAENGDAVTFSSCLAGDVLVGPFSAFTSTTCSALWLSDERPMPAQTATSVSGLLVDAQSALARIKLLPSMFYLATGAPLAVFSNGASAVPGSALVNSKAFGVRWNNNATLNAIVCSIQMPEDLDTSVNPVLHIHASKVGATLADAVTFDVSLWNQVDGALHDADTDFGGTTGAMTGDATSKTIQNVTLTITKTDLAAAPASTTVSIKPTDGTLGTDDLVFHGAEIIYTRKLRAS